MPVSDSSYSKLADGPSEGCEEKRGKRDPFVSEFRPKNGNAIDGPLLHLRPPTAVLKISFSNLSDILRLFQVQGFALVSDIMSISNVSVSFLFFIVGRSRGLKSKPLDMTQSIGTFRTIFRMEIADLYFIDHLTTEFYFHNVSN
ncbi:hypothetical protein HZH66_007174 [Vespula vulgaris]|uniref:Uncharacterized protein n=1 Tax=Vespula vulgaris TaxID=7454 RepID=A0A834JZ42_VESVU|nr:hypothetical protein HZH66_007174 [Vespula vulgaris]